MTDETEKSVICSPADCYFMRFIHLWELAFDWFDWVYLLDIIHLSLKSREFELVQLLQTTSIRYLTQTFKFFSR